jgi:hypothetical protein
MEDRNALDWKVLTWKWKMESAEESERVFVESSMLCSDFVFIIIICMKQKGRRK